MIIKPFKTGIYLAAENMGEHVQLEQIYTEIKDNKDIKYYKDYGSIMDHHYVKLQLEFTNETTG